MAKLNCFYFNTCKFPCFINLPKSKNETDLSLEQMRAMDSNIPIGVMYVPEVPISVDTKEDLINIETNIRQHNDKSW